MNRSARGDVANRAGVEGPRRGSSGGFLGTLQNCAYRGVPKTVRRPPFWALSSAHPKEGVKYQKWTPQ